MTRAKKVILALICAAALCCAAIGGVLLARQPTAAQEPFQAETVAQVRNFTFTQDPANYTSLSASFQPNGTSFYEGQSLDSLKEYLTVTAVSEDGSEILNPGDYTLSGSLTEGECTISVRLATDLTADGTSTTFTVSDVQAFTPVRIEAEAGAAIGTNAELDNVKQYFTVTAYNEEGTEIVLAPEKYTLSGSTAAGNQTITVRLTDNESISTVVQAVFSERVAVQVVLQVGRKEAIPSSTYRADLKNYLTGTVIYNDGTTGSLDRLTTSWNIIETDLDLRPEEDETGNYVRQVQIEFISGDTSVRSNFVDLEIKPSQLIGLTLTSTSNRTFRAMVSIETSDQWEVHAMYEGFIQSEDPLEFGTEYGQVDVVYNPAGQYSDRLEMGDTSVQLTYQEGTTEIEQDFDVSVLEAFIDAPVASDNTMQPVVYTASEQTKVFTGYNAEYPNSMKISADSTAAYAISAEQVTVTEEDVGSYTITFMAAEGFLFNPDNIPSYATPILRDENAEEIIGVTYTWEITAATLDRLEYDFDPDGWVYGQTQENQAKTPDTVTAVYLRADETEVRVSVDPKYVTFIYSGSTNDPGDDEPYALETEMSTNAVPGSAGSYSFSIKVDGLPNYNTFTTEKTDFTIARQGVELPELTQERYTYKGDTITAQYSPTTSEQWTASGETSAVNVKEGGYTIAFALKDSNNYCWGTDGSDDLANKTLTWYIDKANNEITGVDALGWTYGGAIQLPAITASDFDQSDGLGAYSSASVTYTYDGGSFTATTDTLAWHAGTYGYTITYAGNDNINAATKTGTFTVAKGQAVIAGTPTIDGWTYGGTANTPSGVTGVTVSGTTLSPRPGSYAYYGTANGGAAYGSEDDLQTEAPEAAGTYHVVYVVKETDNYKGATVASEEFIISRASISPAVTINGQSSDAGWVYDGEEKAAAVTGNLGKGSVTYTYAGRNHTTYGGSVQPTDAGEYTVTAAVAQTDNYEAGEATLDFTISQKGVMVAFASDTQYTYTGAAVNVVLTVDGNQVDLTDNEYFTVVSGCDGTDAGSYTATIAWKGNYKESGTADDFATAQRNKEVGTWTIDPFAVSLPDELTKTSVYSYNDQFVGTRQTWNWDNYNGFGTALQSGTPFSVTVSASGSGIAEGSYGSQANGQESGYLFATEAGVYTFTLELTSTKNFVWVSGGTDAKELTWTIDKAEVSVDVGEQQLEYDGNKKAPANIVDLNAGDTSVPSAYQNLYTIAGYAVGTTSAAVGTTAPNNYGTYYVAIDLKDGDNFVWKQADQSQDVVSGERLFIWYQITGTTYEITIGTISGWTYGTGTPSVPTLSGDTAILQSVIKNYGSAITYTYQRQRENGQWIDVYTVVYDADDASYLLSVVPAEVADTAGTYRLIVDVSAPSSNNYAPIVDEYSNPFTISPYTLTEGDIAWRELSPTYKGSAYTYGTSADNDVYARYYTYTYENGGYTESSSADAFFSLTLTSGGDAFTDAGSYTFTASTESGNYTLPSSLAVKTYTIAQAKLTIRVTGTYEITYGEAAPTQFTFGYDTLLGNDSAAGWGVAATTDYEQYDPISSDTVKYTISIVEKDYDPNYAISYVDATLTVKAAELTISVNESVSRTYDGLEHSLQEGGSNSIYGSIVNSAVSVNDQAISWKFATAAFNAGNVTSGGSEIGSVRDVADSGTIYYYVSAPNHAAQTGSVQIAITPAELTLTAKDASVVYGEDFTADTSINSYTVQVEDSGSAADTLLGSDTKESVFRSFVPSYQAYVAEGDTYNAGDGVMDNGYIAFACSAPQLDNYTVTLQNGKFTVSPRAITVTIGDVEQTYGDGAEDYASACSVAFTQPAAGVSGTPIYGNDSVFTLAVYDGTGSQIVPDNKTDVGVYYIVGTAENDNYAVTFSGSLSYSSGTNNAGKYEIVARVLGNLDWTDPDSLEYDGTKKVFTATGKYGEGENAEEVSFTITYQRQTGEGAYGEETSDAPVNVGSYKVIARSDDPNFTQGLESTRTFTITPYTVTIDWNEEIKLVYNGEEQSGKVSATYQPVAGDAIALAVTPDAEMKDAAEYTLTASFAEDDNTLGNYALPGVVTQKYTISPRHIVVTIEDQTSEYGDALQTLTATEELGTVTGWTNDGKGAIVPGDAKPYRLYIQGYTGGHLAVGSHNIFGSKTEEGDVIDGNYDVDFSDGTEQANHGVYTVSSRAVTISFAEDTYTATYGTQFDFDAVADQVQFTRGTGGASGSAFADGESFASVLGETQFAVIAEGYSVTSAAGSTFTMQMTLGSTTKSPLSVGNYTFTFTDTATLTVGQRAITVTIADKTDIVYGTDAVANTQLTATAALASGSGEAIVGDTVVYSLAVYDADKNEVTRGSATPAGEYFIVGKAENNNYAITFVGSQNYEGTGDAGLFEIVVSADGIRVEVKNDGATVTYTGSPYYLLDEEEGTYGTLGDLANTLGITANAANGTDGNPFLWQFSFTDSTTTGSDGMPQFTSSVASIKDVTTQNGGVYTVYYIVYLPDNLNYAAATGSFTVKVEQATNDWMVEYGHEGWSYNEQEADASETNPLFDGLESGSQFTAPQAAFGTAYDKETGTVTGVTFTYYTADTYADGVKIADPATFFNYNTPAGTYYVKVEVAGTDNYTGLTGYYELVVAKHILSVRWSPENLTIDDGLSGTSVLGYNDRFMTYVAADLTVTASGTSFTAEKPANTGRYGATFIIKDELLANYEWANADGNDAANCTIYFTVSEAENVVTVTITTDVGGTEGWTYGDSVTFAAYQLGSAGQNGTIVVTATSMQSVSYAYARDVAGVTDGSDSRLVYNISALPTDAGTYWVRAYVTGDIDEGYGNKAGYAKFTVAKYQVAVPTAGALLGGDGGVYDGSVHTYLPTLDGFTWDTNNYGMAVLTLDNGEQVILRVSGNRAIDAGGHTAKVSPVDPDNYVWDDGSAAEKELEWSIEKQTLARPFIGEDGKYSLTTTYSPSTTMQELIGFNAEVMGFAGAAYGSSYYYANDVSYLQAANAGEYWISISLKYPQNYQWATGDGYNGEDADAYTRLTWTIAKAEFDIHNYIDDIQFAVGEYIYNGQVQYPRLEDVDNLPSGVRLVGYEVTAGNGTDAGEHTVTATFALTGSHADNYTFTAGGNALTQEYTIDKAVISGVTWTVQRHYTYNGEDQFDVVKAYYGLGGSIHELQVGVQEFKNYQEGGYTFEVAGFKTDDENAKNHTLSGTFSETFYIDKLSVYIVVGEASGSHTYDGQRPTPTEYGFGKVAVYGIDGDDLRDDFIELYDKADWEANMRFALLDADGNTPRAWNVGSYTVTVTGAEDLQNYDVTRIQTGTLEIVPKEITITGFDSPGATFGDDVFESAAVTAVSGLANGETIGVLNFLYTYTGTADDGWTADGTLTNAMHAGSYTVNVSLQGGNYVLAGDVSYIYKVSPMLVDPGLVEIDDLPYTGQAQTLTKEDTRFTGMGSAYGLFDYSVAAESGTEVGGYNVTLIIGNVNYLWQSSAAGYGNMTTDRTWRIVAAQAEDISVSLPQVSITDWGKTAASVTASGSVAAIGGTEISVNITYLFEVKDESGSWVKFTGSVWNAGDYRVRAEAASDNFPAAYSEYHEFTVQPGVYDVSGLAFADMTLTYDGQAHGLVLTVNGSAAAGGSIGGGALGATGTVAYTLGGAETDAGTYTMTATLTAGANYTFAGGETAYELTGTLVIEPYTVTIQWAAGDFTYDGQDHAGDVWAYFIGAGNSHIDLALEGADEMVDAGEYTFTVTGASDQSGAAVDLANYMLAGGDVAGAQKEYTVRKFAATVNWGQTSFTYNGEDQSASVQPSFVGVGGEEIALSVSPQALRDFGTYTFEVVIGEELKNYELSNTEAQIFIAKLPVTVTADDISAALGAAEQNLTYTLAPSEAAGVFAADEAAGRVEVSLSRVPGTAAGAYDIYISVTGEGAENYALTLVGGTYTIRERAIELSITLPADLVYSGAPKAAVLIAKEVGGGEIAVPAGITLWYEGKDNAGNAYASAQAPVNAGSYTVSVRVDTQDYDVSNADIAVEMIIERAAAFIDVSGVQTQYTYTGALQRVEGGAVLSHGESALVYSNNTFTTVSEGDGKVVSVDAAASCNYKAAHAEVTITVAKAAISPAVSIHGWTYGQSANGYTVTGNPGGGAIEAVYGGTTNAGAAYSGGQAPTEAGSYTLTVTVAETENYLGGSASTSFTVARAALHVSVSIEGWAFGESPNGYTVSPASMRGNISSVRYEGEGYSGSQPPTQVGSYTLTVTFAQTANYQGGSASDSFSITQGTLAPDSVRLTIEGWTYGEAPNLPVLTGAPAGAEVSYRYSGTANDGTAWNSDTAPSKAGSYKVTAHISAAGYVSFEAEASFTVARRLVSAPTLGDTGGRTASSVYDGEEVRIAVTGYDGALMDFTAEEGTQLVMEGQQLLLAADAEGTYVLQVSLKDIYNYGWADLAEGEQIAGDIALAWEVTLAMHSLLWLIVLLLVLLLILIVLLVVFAKKDHDARARIAAAEKGAESGADGAADERQNYALAPAGLLFAVPVWQISLIAALAVAAAALLVADVVLLVLWRKDAAKAERAEEAVQEAAAAAQDENVQAENAQEAGGDENSASAE